MATTAYREGDIIFERKPSTPRIDTKQVIHNNLRLEEIPDDFANITISGFTQVFNQRDITATTFYVHPKSHKIEFHPSQEGKSFTVNYNGIGRELIPQSMIYTDIDNNGVVKTLNTLTDEAKAMIVTAKDTVDTVKRLEPTVAEGKILNTNLGDKISTGTPLNTSLGEKIATGTPLNTNLGNNINTGTTLNDKLTKNNTDGATLHNTLNQDITNATNADSKLKTTTDSALTTDTNLTTKIFEGNTKENTLNNAVANAQGAINTIRNTENKSFTVLANQFVLNSTTGKYEYTLAHNTNSENLVPEFKNTNKSPILVDYQNIDTNNILISLIEPQEVKVIISVSYFGYMDTVDRLNEAVFNANQTMEKIEQKGNKAFTILSTDFVWDATANAYKYNLLHNCNTRNIVSAYYDINGDKLAVGEKIVDLNNMIIFHTKQEQVTVILNLQYMGYLGKKPSLSGFNTDDLTETTNRRFVTTQEKSDIGDTKSELQGARQGKKDINERINSDIQKIEGLINDITLIAPKNSANITLSLQEMLNNAINGSTVRIPRGSYTLVKNTQLGTTLFPKNDMPCLLLNNKENITLIGDGAVFKVAEHGQGILEMQNCKNIEIKGIKFEGCGVFPALDGATGRGEKGNSTEGYGTIGNGAPHDIWGYYKNNCKDTSANTLGGNVPKPWGKFQNGFIGNAGMGILIKHGCENIIINKVEITGFNFAGLAVGWFGDIADNNDQIENPLILEPINKNITIRDSYIHDCYSSGIHNVYVDGFNSEGRNIITRIGHPDALITDATSDPGYGVSHIGFKELIPKNVNIFGMRISDCIRKGVDVHTGKDITVEKNTIENCRMEGIYAHWHSADQPVYDIVIRGNKLTECSYRKDSAGTIKVGSEVAGGRQFLYLNAIIEDNDLIRCGSGTSSAIICCKKFDGLTIKNNRIIGVSSQLQDTSNALYGISVGSSGTPTYNLICKDNYINIESSRYARLLYAVDIVGGEVNDNRVLGNPLLNMSGAGVYLVNCKDVNCIDNYVKLGSYGTPIAASQTTGYVHGNIGLGGDQPNYNQGSGFILPTIPVGSESSVVQNGAIYVDDKGRLRHSNGTVIGEYRKCIHLKITANTGNGTPTYITGEQFVSGVSSSANGLVISLANMPTNIFPYAVVSEGGSTGLSAGSTQIGYKYTRGSSSANVEIGLKATFNSSSHTPFNQCTSGVLDILIFI